MKSSAEAGGFSARLTRLRALAERFGRSNGTCDLHAASPPGLNVSQGHGTRVGAVPGVSEPLWRGGLTSLALPWPVMPCLAVARRTNHQWEALSPSPLSWPSPSTLNERRFDLASHVLRPRSFSDQQSISYVNYRHQLNNTPSPTKRKRFPCLKRESYCLISAQGREGVVS